MPIRAGSIRSRSSGRSHRFNRIFMLRLFLLTALILVVPLSKAQSWPQKPVRVIVPFAPGGASDLMPRLVGEKLAAIWAQPVVIDNRPGAAGNIGMEAGA